MRWISHMDDCAHSLFRTAGLLIAKWTEIEKSSDSRIILLVVPSERQSFPKFGRLGGKMISRSWFPHKVIQRWDKVANNGRRSGVLDNKRWPLVGDEYVNIRRVVFGSGEGGSHLFESVYRKLRARLFLWNYYQIPAVDGSMEWLTRPLDDMKSSSAYTPPRQAIRRWSLTVVSEALPANQGCRSKSSEVSWCNTKQDEIVANITVVGTCFLDNLGRYSESTLGHICRERYCRLHISKDERLPTNQKTDFVFYCQRDHQPQSPSFGHCRRSHLNTRGCWSCHALLRWI